MNSFHPHILSLLAGISLLAACSGGNQKPLELNSEADLAGLTLSCTSGSYYDRKYSVRKDVSVFAADSESNAVQAVCQGHADVYVSDEIMLTREAMERLGLKIAMRGDESLDVAFAVSKNNNELRRSLDAFLSSAPLDSIVSRWLEGTPDAVDTAAARPATGAPLRCITVVNIEPVSYLGGGGQWMGLDPDLLCRYAHAAGRPFEMQFQNLGSAIIALQTGQADIISGCLFVTEERKAFVDYSIPYYKCGSAFFVSTKGREANIGLGERIRMNLVAEQRWKLIADGLLETLKITLLAVLLGTVLGCGVCAARRSRRKWLRTAARLYGSFISGMPTLVLLLIMFYVVFARSGISASIVAIITFALCFASSAGNVFDTSISSVPGGQTEAGLSLGFTPFKTFTGIVFPQALKKGLPIYTGECVSLLKGTSIVGYIAIQDLTRASDLIRSRTYDALIPLVIVTILYFVLAWFIRRLLNLFLIKK